MIVYTHKQEVKQYAATDGTVFDVIAIYNPNEEDDTWIKYQNSQTKQEYTCRFEAFQSRFHPLLD